MAESLEERVAWLERTVAVLSTVVGAQLTGPLEPDHALVLSRAISRYLDDPTELNELAVLEAAAHSPARA